MNAKNVIANIANELEENYKQQGLFELDIEMKMPNREDIIYIINEVRRVMFPGYFGTENTAYVNLSNFAGNTIAGVYERLFKQIKIALKYQGKIDGQEVKDADDKSESIALEFVKELPALQKLIMKDVEAELQGDPAASSKEEIIFSYPGLYAIYVYRIAHVLYELNVPIIPRIMTEHAHSKTGIDINPGANIGEYFFIDHGTGIVIGETTVIGNHVKIYQGVTLGGLSTRGGQKLNEKKRHPTIGNNVTIYSGASILGGETLIGDDVVVGGNTFIVNSVEKGTRVSAKKQELKYSNGIIEKV